MSFKIRNLFLHLNFDINSFILFKGFIFYVNNISFYNMYLNNCIDHVTTVKDV